MLEKMLIHDEGLELKPYKCSMGKLTIGVGRNISDVGISENEAMILLGNDIANVIRQLEKFDWYRKLDEVRKHVLINMGFNLGINKLLGFKNMISALSQKDYDRAADEMKNSKWATQVKGRAVRLEAMMRTGIHAYKEIK